MKTSSKENTTKKVKVNFRSFFLSIFSTIFIFGGSFLIYYFSKGYRIDVDGAITKTGVLTVQTEPSSVNLYINGNEIGKTPRSRTLNTGIQYVSLWKEGYREWKKNVNIVEEKSTPIYPFLILEKIENTVLWKSEKIVEKSWINKYSDYFVFLLKDSDTQYSLWTYKINPSLWDLNPNPIQILSLETNNIDLIISPNGEVAILEITTEIGVDSYLIELHEQSTLENLVSLDISDLVGYEISWAKDNQHIILESDVDIISIDTTRNIRYLLFKKSPLSNYIWSTDELGFFYLIEPLHTENDPTYMYALKQIKLDGTNTKYTIERAYFQKNAEYIEYYRTNEESCPEFTNSPECTQTTGQIIYFEVNQNSNGVYIQTDTSSYWYDIIKNKYRMISPYSAELIEFSPDSRKLLFTNGEGISVFTFEKEEEDHTEQIGSKNVDSLIKNEIPNIQWLSNSSYLAYIKDNTLFISEKDGENAQDIILMDNILLFSIKNSREYVVTLETDIQGIPSIIQYRIN